jgi:hypothetical protein
MPRGFTSCINSEVHENLSSSAAILLPSGAAVHNSLRMLNPSLMPVGPTSSSLRLQQQQQQQQQQQHQQQILPLMSFNSSSFSMPPSILPPPVATTSCGQLQYLQHQQQQQQLQQLLLREREDNHNHPHHHHQSSGNMAMSSSNSIAGGGQQHNTHAIQLQTSLEMAGPVVCPALCEIRTQLQELTRSVESCQNEARNYKNKENIFKIIVSISLLKTTPNPIKQ